MNIFESKVYRRILGPVYDNEKENWRILTKKEIYASVKKPTIIETMGDRGSTVVKVLCYKSEGHWFDPSWCQWNFH
jgi:hypothetical protein